MEHKILYNSVLIGKDDPEVWLPVKGWEGLYEVSSWGYARSIERMAMGGHKKRQKINVKQRILRFDELKEGYLRVRLVQRPVKSCWLIHRLVASHFIPNPENKPEVNHLDEDKSNNAAWNLAWATESENMVHSSINRDFSKKRPRIDNEIVLEIAKSTLSLNKLSKIYNIPRLTIQAIKSGKRYGKITGKVYFGEIS